MHFYETPALREVKVKVHLVSLNVTCMPGQSTGPGPASSSATARGANFLELLTVLRQLLTLLALTSPLCCFAAPLALTADNCEVTRLGPPVPAGLSGCVIEVGAPPPDGLLAGGGLEDVSSLRVLNQPSEVSFNLCASWPSTTLSLLNPSLTAMEVDFKRDVPTEKSMLVLSVDMVAGLSFLSIDWVDKIDSTGTLTGSPAAILGDTPVATIQIPTCSDPWAKGIPVKVRTSGKDVEIKLGVFAQQQTVKVRSATSGTARLKATEVRFFPFLKHNADGALFSSYWPTL